MADIYEIASVAAAQTVGGTAHAAAVLICEARGELRTYDTVNFGGLWMARWQAVVAESLLLDAIREDLLNG